MLSGELVPDESHIFKGLSSDLSCTVLLLPTTTNSASMQPFQLLVVTFAGAPGGTNQLVSVMPMQPFSNFIKAMQASGDK